MACKPSAQQFRQAGRPSAGSAGTADFRTLAGYFHRLLAPMGEILPRLRGIGTYSLIAENHFFSSSSM